MPVRRISKFDGHCAPMVPLAHLIEKHIWAAKQLLKMIATSWTWTKPINLQEASYFANADHTAYLSQI